MVEMDDDHRLADAEPEHQPDDDPDDPHRLAGALPKQKNRSEPEHFI